RRGVTPKSVVAVRLPRSREAIIALLGIWRAGAVYLPLDPQWPEERVAFVLRDAAVHTTIDRTWTEHDDASLAGLVMGYHETRAPEGRAGVAPDDPAYLIYTSGSTGAPKGVLVPHRGLVPVLEAQIRELGLGPGKRGLLVLSTCFDASLSDIG